MELRSTLNERATEWPEVALHASPTRLAAAALGCAAFAALGVAMILGPKLGWTNKPPWIGQLIGWPALIFGLALTIAGVRLALTRDPIVTVGPLGVRDTRLSPDWIPWAAITGLSAASWPPPPFLLLHIDPAFEATMALTRGARWARPVNAATARFLWGSATTSYDGHVIRGDGLKGGLEAILRAIEEGWARA
jgi:hypothetical protein